MNKSIKASFKKYVDEHRAMLLSTLRTGEGRPVVWQESNYRDLQEHLTLVGLVGAGEDDVQQAAQVFHEQTQRTLEVAKPPSDGGASRLLAEIQRDASTVRTVQHGINVYLDNDQNKHQHPTVRIGNRDKGGGNRFKAQCDAAWHLGKTLQHMADWANRLGRMDNGAKQYHGQSTPVDGIHYEGFCVSIAGNKHVLFHCYPANGSPLKL